MNRAIRSLCAALPLALAACAGGQQGTEKELADLKTEMSKLRADQAAAEERLDALEINRGGLKGYAAPSASAGSDRPELNVVKLGPDPGSESDDPDADGTRPVLRSSGSGAVIEETATPGKSNGSAQGEYDRAVGFVRSRQFDKAIEALSSFVLKYPDNPNADDASFLRGDCYFAKSEWRRAAEQYEAVATNYASGNKAPDALLKAAQSYGKLGDNGAADQAKKKLLATYPASDAAKKLARQGPKP